MFSILVVIFAVILKRIFSRLVGMCIRKAITYSILAKIVE
jgi:hypothetical protein